jgi:predicted metal-binding protein
VAFDDKKISVKQISDTEVSDTERAGAAGERPVGTERATIYVCITCRGPSGLAVDPPPGALVAAATVAAARGSDVAVRPIKCLANCSRGPSAALRADGSWTYLFGGLDAGAAPALVIGARMLAAAPDGILPWRGRPDVLKRGLIARIPPLDHREESE